MKCMVCGRALKDPVSVKRQIGPVCLAKRMHLDKEAEKKLADIPLDSDPNGDIILKRIDGRPATNVPHRWVQHSPTGYEWGYAGSGPADLALNILLMFVNVETADLLHQDFKREFIANMPEEGGIIRREDIEHWIVAHTGTLQRRLA